MASNVIQLSLHFEQNASIIYLFINVIKCIYATADLILFWNSFISLRRLTRFKESICTNVREHYRPWTPSNWNGCDVVVDNRHSEIRIWLELKCFVITFDKKTNELYIKAPPPEYIIYINIVVACKYLYIFCISFAYKYSKILNMKRIYFVNNLISLETITALCMCSAALNRQTYNVRREF